MAKIFSTEKLSLNGDKIRLQSSAVKEFEVTDSSGVVLISKGTIESNIDSLNTQDATDKSIIESTIGSLSTLESTNTSTIESNVDSLNTQDATDKSIIESTIGALSTLESTNTSTLHSHVSSLHEQDADNKSAIEDDIDSLNTLVTTNDVYAANITSLSQNDNSVTIDYSSVGYTTNPTAMGMLRSSDTNDPIISIQISGAPTKTGVTFKFSDDLPSDNYSLDILVSV
jgi:hypothetical protein